MKAHVGIGMPQKKQFLKNVDYLVARFKEGGEKFRRKMLKKF